MNCANAQLQVVAGNGENRVDACTLIKASDVMVGIDRCQSKPSLAQIESRADNMKQPLQTRVESSGSRRGDRTGLGNSLGRSGQSHKTVGAVRKREAEASEEIPHATATRSARSRRCGCDKADQYVVPSRGSGRR